MWQRAHKRQFAALRTVPAGHRPVGRHRVGDSTHTGQYADVYHLRDGKITAHWHLAVDPKADAEAASELFAS
jgi:hypothetical protein